MNDKSTPTPSDGKHMAQAVLHIGTEKTGTTSIQAFLSRNRSVLRRKKSVLYPRSPGIVNHLKISAYAADTGKGIAKWLGPGELREHERRREEFAEAFVEEVIGAKCSRLLLSNEHCHSRLSSVREIARLNELLSRVAQSTRIVIYLRRQDRMAVSLYSTAIKEGYAPEAFFDHGPKKYYFNLLAIYKNWAEVFGAANMSVRIFAPAEFAEGDLYRDFMLATGIGWDEELTVPEKRLNTSISLIGQELLKEFNASVRRGMPRGRQAESTERFVRLISKHLTGMGKRPARSEALEFYRRFIEKNEALRRLCFPSRLAPLFDEDFSEYPEKADSLDPRNRELMDVVLAICREGFWDVRGLEAAQQDER